MALSKLNADDLKQGLWKLFNDVAAGTIEPEVSRAMTDAARVTVVVHDSQLRTLQQARMAVTPDLIEWAAPKK